MHPPQNVRTASSVSRNSREAGFSVIEGLIAALLLLIITLGILPLFDRAMRNNTRGNDSSRQAHAGITAFETADSVPLNSASLVVPAGETELVVTEVLALKQIASPTGGVSQTMSTRWELPADLGSYDQPVLQRQTTTRYYSLSDLEDNQTFDDPLDGGAEERLVHFKVVEVDVQDLTGTERRPYRLRSVKAY